MPVSNTPLQENPVTPEVESVKTAQEPNMTQESAQKPQESKKIYGLSAAEEADPNSIVVTVSDSKAPLVVLFGPPACGKTMTLVRLTRFLKQNGYTVSPIRTFRPSSDDNYSEICSRFDIVMNSSMAADATDRISFMLVEVIKNGRRICQILEAPGEHYFNPKKPQDGFPSYVNTIIASSNRKLWTIIVEPDWMDPNDRSNYVDRINSLKQNMRSKDSTLFVFNKIDKTKFVRQVGDINKSAAINEVNNLYPGIFAPFMNQNPITRIFKEYNCDFIPFQTGTYTPSSKGTTYQEGPREYCVKLWDAIMNYIRG